MAVHFADVPRAGGALEPVRALPGRCRVGPGDHAGVFGRNSVELVETFLAVCELRAAPVNINYRYTGAELRYMFRDADLTALVHERSLAPLVAAEVASAPGLRAPVVIGSTYEEAVASESPGRDFPERGADDVYLIYTGGTTGYPKGVMWRHEDIWRTLAGGIDFATGVPLPDEWEHARRARAGSPVTRLTVAPLIHSAAQVPVLGALFAGDTAVVLARFDAHELWRAVQRYRVSNLMVIGDAMARPLVEACRNRVHRNGTGRGRGGRAGRECAARLLQRPGQDRRAVHRGRREAVRGPGDMARVEEDGSFTLLGRGSTCVNTGGEKVYPEEVEDALKSHPDVFDAVVIGVPDDRLGQRVAALVQPRNGVTLDVTGLAWYLRGHVAGYKVPRSVWITNTIGRTPTGKPDYNWARRFAGEHPPVAG